MISCNLDRATFFCTPMKINKEQSIRIETLRQAGGAISKQLGIGKSTISIHCQKMNHLSKLPPKEVRYKGLIQDRKQIQIKQYILWIPKDTLDDIINGCDLEFSNQIALPDSPSIS